MKLFNFNYNLPEELIAQYPLKKRDEARMMVIDRKSGTITHDVFKNLSQHIPEQTQFVLNDSKVIPARLFGQKEKTGAQVEVFLLKRLEDGCSYEVLMRPMKRLREGMKIVFEEGVEAEIINKDERTVRFNIKNLKSFLQKHGHIPLPPYIKREDETSDRGEYQTVYAKTDGSVAAPTAGMHFTKEQIAQLKKDKHHFHRVTLHIGYGTFKPVEEEDIEDHKIHYEYYEMPKKTWSALQGAKNICAIGTTSTRVLESAAQTEKLADDTNLFIYPGFSFRMVDLLLTNFHLPKSTLLMLVYAFGGVELMQKAYEEAVQEKYRFYSYGDCMLIM